MLHNNRAHRDVIHIEACPLPEHALLRGYLDDGAYTDCFMTTIGGHVLQSEYVRAFYTTWLFKCERLILQMAVNRPSTDDEARRLGLGTLDRFAAWQLESRCNQQLLLRDDTGRTRSWLMSVPAAGGASTRLYFGSAVIARTNPIPGKTSTSSGDRILLGFHKLYSRMLLRAAHRRLHSG